MTSAKRFTKEERDEILRSFRKEWGTDAEVKMAIEEMAELIKELCNSWRDRTKADEKSQQEHIERVREEIADVLITVRNIQLIYGENEVEEIIDTKLHRGLARLKEWQKENKK